MIRTGVAAVHSKALKIKPECLGKRSPASAGAASSLWTIDKDGVAAFVLSLVVDGLTSRVSRPGSGRRGTLCKVRS